MEAGAVVNIVAVLIALGALGVSIFSLKASQRTVSATIYEHRYKIYGDAEKFLAAWMRDARSDLTMLGTLVGAWSRSHFLCNAEVTAYLRRIWTDAVRANLLNDQNGAMDQAQRAAAIEEATRLLVEHGDYDRLRERFMADLRV
jgi:hypothetical protein